MKPRETGSSALGQALTLREAATLFLYYDTAGGQRELEAFLAGEGSARPVPAFEEAELDELCLASRARFKRPCAYHWLDELPKNSTGKVLKRELRELLAEKAAGEEPAAAAAMAAPGTHSPPGSRPGHPPRALFVIDMIVSDKQRPHKRSTGRL